MTLREGRESPKRRLTRKSSLISGLVVVPTGALYAQTVVDFEGQSGLVPDGVGGINWNANWIADPAGCGGCDSTVIFMADAEFEPTCRTFSFQEPSILESFDASLHSAPSNGGTLIVSTDEGDMIEVYPELGACTTYPTGFTQAAAEVTVCFDHGWELGLDNIKYTTGPACPCWSAAEVEEIDGEADSGAPLSIACSAGVTAAFAMEAESRAQNEIAIFGSLPIAEGGPGHCNYTDRRVSPHVKRSASEAAGTLTAAQANGCLQAVLTHCEGLGF